MNTDDAPKLQPLAHSPDSAARRLGVSTRSVYLLVSTGQLKSCKVGKRRLIPDHELVRLIDRKMAEAG